MAIEEKGEKGSVRLLDDGTLELRAKIEGLEEEQVIRLTPAIQAAAKEVLGAYVMKKACESGAPQGQDRDAHVTHFTRQTQAQTYYEHSLSLLLDLAVGENLDVFERCSEHPQRAVRLRQSEFCRFALNEAINFGMEQGDAYYFTQHDVLGERPRGTGRGN